MKAGTAFFTNLTTIVMDCQHNTHTQHSIAVEAAIPPRGLTPPGGRREREVSNFLLVIDIANYLSMAIKEVSNHILIRERKLLTILFQRRALKAKARRPYGLELVVNVCVLA